MYELERLWLADTENRHNLLADPTVLGVAQLTGRAIMNKYNDGVIAPFVDLLEQSNGISNVGSALEIVLSARDDGEVIFSDAGLWDERNAQFVDYRSQRGEHVYFAVATYSSSHGGRTLDYRNKEKLPDDPVILNDGLGPIHLRHFTQTYLSVVSLAISNYFVNKQVDQTRLILDKLQRAARDPRLNPKLAEVFGKYACAA